MVVSGGDIFRFSINIYNDSAYSKEDKLFDRGDNVYIQVAMSRGGSPIRGAAVTAALKVSNGAITEDTVNLIEQFDGAYAASWPSAGHTADVYLVNVDTANPGGSGKTYFHLYSGSGVSSYRLDYNEDANKECILENKHLICVYDSVDNTDKLLLYLEQKDTGVSYSFKDTSFVNSAGRSEVTSDIRKMLFSSFSLSGQGEEIFSANIDMTAAAADMPDGLITYYDDLSDVDMSSIDSNSWIAQQFNPADIDKDCVLTKVTLAVNKIDQFYDLGYTQPLIVEIRTDDNGQPSDTVLASESISHEKVPNVASWFDVEFSSPPALNQGGSYWLVLKNYDEEWLGLYVYAWYVSLAPGYAGNMAYTQDRGATWNDNSAYYDMLFYAYGREEKPGTSFKLNVEMGSQNVDYLIYKLSGFDANLSSAVSDLFSSVSGSLGPNIEDDKYHIGNGTDYPVDYLAADEWTNFSALTDEQKYIAMYDNSDANDTVNNNVISWVYFPNANALNFKDVAARFEADREGIRIRYDTAGGISTNEAKYLLVFTQGDHSAIGRWMSTIVGGALPIPNFMSPSSSAPVMNFNSGIYYPAIKEAIEAEQTIDGHKIWVQEGRYSEAIVVNKGLVFEGGYNETYSSNTDFSTVIGSMVFKDGESKIDRFVIK